jgi:ABC-type oligopeptide transport system ATPase subunit
MNINEIKAQALARLEAIKAGKAAPVVATPPPKLSLQDILKAQQEAATKKLKETVVEVPTVASITATMPMLVDWNDRQQLAIKYAQQGKSFCLIGAAGTGKTTTLKGCIQILQASNSLPILKSNTKYLHAGLPGIAFVSYTRRAVRQIAKQLPKDMAMHAITLHKLLEFEPVFYEYTTPDGRLAKTMRFEPARHGGNPLPRDLRCIVVDESSMVSTDLFNMLCEAMNHGFQVIFLGDLHQLPPVYGEAILANKLQELPVVELTEVYRQALDSPIIRLATDIKDGKEIPVNAKVKWTSPDGKSNVVINPWPKQLSGEDAMDGLTGTINNVIKSGNFNEEEDVILMPFNKSCGTIELNLHIANTLAIQRGAVVHHVIAGFIHWYLAVGDRLLVDKQDCIIKGIEKNPRYVGKSPLEPATTLDRWGTYQDEKVHHHLEESDEDIDALLERMADQNVEDKVNQASHVLVLESLDSGATFRVSEVGTINNMVFSYALTVHKSQGSEWRRVFLFLHSSHHMMCSRELVYTAVTRAKEDLIIICEPDRKDSPGTLTRAAKNPRIKGNTLEEKLAWLKERSKEKMNGNGDIYGK